MPTLIDLPVGFNRLSDSPLDQSSVFNSLNELNSYCSDNPTCYSGQIVFCVETNQIYVISSSKQPIVINSQSSSIFAFWSGFSSIPAIVSPTSLSFFNRTSKINTQRNALVTLNKDLQQFIAENQLVGGTIDATNYPFLTHLEIYNCQLTSVQTNGSANLGYIYLQSNSLETFDVSGNPLCYFLNLRYNKLTQNAVDAILNTIDSFPVWSYPGGTKECLLNFGENAPPSSNGLSRIPSLISKGWHVTYN